MTLTNQNIFVFASVLPALLLGALVSLSGCGGDADGATDAGQQPVRVVATTTVIEDLARQLAGDDAEVIGIMKTGEDPHVYDVRPNDAVTISNADLILTNGFHLEATLGGVIEQAARGTVVHLAETADLDPLGSEVYQGAPDPHVWMDVEMFRRVAEAARDALIEADPEHAEGYRQRAEDYLAELDELQSWVQQQWDPVPKDQRVVVTSHDAVNYYAAAYGVTVHGVIGISTDAQPQASDIEALRNMIKDRGVRALFVETSVAPTLNQIVRNLAQDTGVAIGGSLYSDSLGPDDSPGGTYVGMIRHNTTTMVEALK
jgi:manganese/zinc/iron transport system substrate-binding protein